MSSVNWIRRADLDQAFMDMHGIMPIVHHAFYGSNKYSVKLNFSGKEFVLTDEMDRGKTKFVSLVGEGKTYSCDGMFSAEKLVTQLFKE